MGDKSTIHKIPAYSLYGESAEFPDVLHCERITDRAHKHDWHFAPHRHLNLHQVFLITDGHVSMTLDGATTSIPAMSVVVIPPHFVHGFTFQKQTSGFVLSVPSAEIMALASWDSQIFDIFHTSQVIPASTETIKTMELIHKEHHGANCARLALLRSLTVQLACYLAASVAQKRQMVNPVRGLITKFEHLAREHISDSWKVADYASELGISATHLNRLSKDVLGQSPKDFLHMLVVQEAKRLLAYTKMDVASIGYRIGFEDPSYFSRMFMRQTGQSPRGFRQVFEGEG